MVATDFIVLRRRSAVCEAQKGPGLGPVLCKTGPQAPGEVDNRRKATSCQWRDREKARQEATLKGRILRCNFRRRNDRHSASLTVRAVTRAPRPPAGASSYLHADPRSSRQRA